MRLVKVKDTNEIIEKLKEVSKQEKHINDMTNLEIKLLVNRMSQTGYNVVFLQVFDKGNGCEIHTLDCIDTLAHLLKIFDKYNDWTTIYYC